MGTLPKQAPPYPMAGHRHTVCQHQSQQKASHADTEGMHALHCRMSNTSAQVSLHAAAGQEQHVQRCRQVQVRWNGPHIRRQHAYTNPSTKTLGKSLETIDGYLPAESAHMTLLTVLANCTVHMHRAVISGRPPSMWHWSASSLRCTEQQSSLVHVCSKPQGSGGHQRCSEDTGCATNR